MMRVTTKSKASIGVCVVLQRYRQLKNGDFSKTVQWTKTIWVRCNEDEWHDISNAGGCHEELVREVEKQEREKWQAKNPKWWVSATESWGVSLPRR